MATIKTILFDFGNVVGYFDHHRAIRQLAAYTHIPAERIEGLLYCSDLNHAFEMGKISKDDYFRQAADIIGIQLDLDAFHHFYTDIFWENDSICELIPRLAGRYRLVLASNTNDAHYGRFRQMFEQTLGHFDAICVSHEAGARKPMGEFYQYCQTFAAAAPEECYFIDDLEANIAAAIAHGWHGHIYRDTAALLEDFRHYRIELD